MILPIHHIDNLVSGLLNVFRYYESTGVYSFNASLFFGPMDQQSFPCHFRITPRTFLNTRDFAPDMNFFQTVLAEPICVELPEELCREVKPFFSNIAEFRRFDIFPKCAIFLLSCPFIKILSRETEATGVFIRINRLRKKQLEDLVELARLSPSTANMQPLKFILSWKPEKNDMIFSCLAWAGYLKDWHGP